MAVALPRPRSTRRRPVAGAAGTGPLALGVTTMWLSLIVLIPLAAVVAKSMEGGFAAFWDSVTSRQAVSALQLTLSSALIVAAINAVTGTLVAWVLVRDRFRGKALVNAVIDLPFALPTIVAGLTLMALYGPKTPIGINFAFTKLAIICALLFVTLPFVVRTVQPVLLELDTEMEEAAHSLGAGRIAVLRRIVLPNLLPGILSGVVLALARALGEIGSIVVISGNNPFHTEVASVFIFNQIQSGYPEYAAAVATVLLATAFVLLLAVGALRFFATRHERA